MTRTRSTAKEDREQEILMRVMMLHDDLRAVAMLQLGIGCDAMRATEIAERLGISPTTAMTRMRVVLKAVRDPTWSGEITTSETPMQRRIRHQGTMLCLGHMTITRHGEDEYRIDGTGRYDADGVGSMIARTCAAERRSATLSYLASRDRWVWNGLRAALRGVQWPHEPGDVPRLPILENDDVSPLSEPGPRP